MKSFAHLIVATFFSVNAAVAQELIVPAPEDWTFTRYANFSQRTDAYYDAANQQFYLTSPSTGYVGDFSNLTMSRPFCGNDYMVSFDAYVGAATNAGGSISLNFKYPHAAWHFAGIHIDTFKDAAIWEPNNNHFDIYSDYLDDPTNTNPISSVATLKNQVATPAIFPIRGSWMKVEFRNSRGDLTLSVSNGVAKQVLIARAKFVPNAMVIPHFTGSSPYRQTSSPIQIVKNIKIHILESCAQPDEATINAMIDPDGALNSCPIAPADKAAILERLNALKADGSISAETHEKYRSKIESREGFCQGSSACLSDLESAKQAAWDEGFQAGVSSIDQDAIRQAGFASGVASIDQEAIRAAGFEAGAASIDQEAIRQAGFDAGVASIDQEAIKQAAFAAGVASVPACEVKGNNKVKVCHVAGNGKTETLEIAESAVKAHLAHGDTLGECRAPVASKR